MVMRNINEYMMQASDFHSVNEYLSTKVKIKTSFPKEIESNVILHFLDDNGFKQCTDKRVFDDSSGMTEIYEFFKNNDKSYIYKEYKEYSYWLRIFKGGKPSKDNPIFVMQVENNNDGTNEFELYGVEYEISDDYDWTHEQFLNEINKHFGWQ